MPGKGQVQAGDEVEINFWMKLKDTPSRPSTDQQKPLITHFTAGGREVFEPVSQAVIGMRPGERKQVLVPPEKSYGRWSESLVTEVSKAKLPPDTKEGDNVKAFESEKTWRVSKIHDNSVVLDGNHPMAGKTLLVDVEITSIK
jgi:peptidylprolyl isomerase